MRLEDMTPAHVRRAIAIYLELAFPPGSTTRPRIDPRSLEDAATLNELFARFERPAHAAGLSLQRFTLRLGNARYPFMKFVVQEYLVDAEYFFSVDTHDDIDIRPDNPDYDAWQELKRANAELKQQIEAAWRAAELPTNSDLRLLAHNLAQVERESQKRARLLIADDETEIAACLQDLLEARGYQVELCFDGRSVLERLEQEPLPDLLLLDNAMPLIKGAEVLARVRENPRLKNLPVLLATAGSIKLEDVPRASGFLRKPYPRQVLFAMLAQLLSQPKPQSS